MAAELIGPCKCPLCGGRARLSLSSKQLPVLTCNSCNMQLFTRSDRSDTLARGLLILEAKAPEALPTIAPTVNPQVNSAPPKPPTGLMIKW